jgi:hypothetical protein
LAVTSTEFPAKASDEAQAHLLADWYCEADALCCSIIKQGTEPVIPVGRNRKKVPIDLYWKAGPWAVETMPLHRRAQ